MFYTCGIEYEVDEVNRTVRQVLAIWKKKRGYRIFLLRPVPGVQYFGTNG